MTDEIDGLKAGVERLGRDLDQSEQLGAHLQRRYETTEKDLAWLEAALAKRDQLNFDRGWNAALEAATKTASAYFLYDPYTSPAIHILGLRK